MINKTIQSDPSISSGGFDVLWYHSEPAHIQMILRLFAGDFTEERNCLNKPYKDGVISDQEEIMGKCYSPHSGNEGNSLFYCIYT